MDHWIEGGRTTRAHRRPVWALVCLAFLPAGIAGQAASEEQTLPVHPTYRWAVEAPVIGISAGLLFTARQLSVTHRVVPPAGLDRNDIRLSFDRNVVGNVSTRAGRESDYFLAAALAYPMVISLASQPSGTRVSGTLRRSLEYVEAVALAGGITNVLKKAIDRPRPYNYLSDAERPSDPSYDVTRAVAFRSMPSGHTAASFTGAAFAMTDHLLTRPHASWQERVAVSAVGGFLAGMTATLRVQGGHHFPSDTFVGGLIGTSSGVSVPLLHRYVRPGARSEAPMPSTDAWWQAFAGLVGGVSLGMLTARLY